MKKISTQQKNFCRWLLALGNPFEAARHVARPDQDPDALALSFLDAPQCRAFLSAPTNQLPLPLHALCIAGLSRLAFGNPNDVLQLIFSEPSPDQLKNLDLFHVTAIRKDKNGIEIKLADRQKAMEQLLIYAGQSHAENAAAALLSALADNGEEVPDEALLPQTETRS